MYIQILCFLIGTMDRGTAGTFRIATCASPRSKSASSRFDKYLGAWRTSFTYESRFFKYSDFGSTSTGYVITT